MSSLGGNKKERRFCSLSKIKYGFLKKDEWMDGWLDILLNGAFATWFWRKKEKMKKCFSLVRVTTILIFIYRLKKMLYGLLVFDKMSILILMHCLTKPWTWYLLQVGITYFKQGFKKKSVWHRVNMLWLGQVESEACACHSL